ncbi:UNVERIFIED_CONTAM: hypothetical protein GTU68_005946 [Idotea baltica]|nr:hypothetical protein [Idotea baltica]
MIENLTTEAIQLLKNLIATQSFSSEEDNTAVIIENWFKDNEIDFKRSNHNVYAFNKFFNKEKPTLLLNSHHDTVKPNSAYTRDPLKPEIIDGKLFGLGSNDAGGCLVSLIALFTYFYNHKNLKYNLIIVASAEEESSGKNGLNSVLPILPTIDVAIVGEPTLMQDVRITDAYSNKEVLEIIKNSVNVEVKERSLRLNSSSIPKEHALVKAGIALGRETYGSPTLSDQAVLTCPSLKLGPGDSLRSHTADEFIFVNEIEEGIKIYINLLTDVIV